MFKKIIWTFIIVIVALIGWFTYIVYTDFSASEQPVTEEPAETETESPQEEGEEEPILLNEQGDEDKNPFNTTMKQEEVTEEVMRDFIHKMSHQKIEAEAKWGLIEITDERIDWLLKSVDKTKEPLQHKEVYKKILTRWADGDFSHAVEDHNTIWEMQGGNIGEAIRLLTAEEEKAYLESKRK
ncbi:DUF6241 domain-containing protein [Pseudogracilibacillus sp. SO30301A]|uniref:DUF6241 domain-containing protein n=1 Tax=Pseudogracilibacillus sp. SO30301A TaxID=3098291 RepID=UPI00300E5A77